MDPTGLMPSQALDITSAAHHRLLEFGLAGLYPQFPSRKLTYQHAATLSRYLHVTQATGGEALLDELGQDHQGVAGEFVTK